MKDKESERKPMESAHKMGKANASRWKANTKWEKHTQAEEKRTQTDGDDNGLSFLKSNTIL